MVNSGRHAPGKFPLRITVIICFRVALLFGVLSLMSGLIGIPVGYILAQRFKKVNERADALICGISLLASVPLVCGALVTSSVNIIVTCILVFTAEASLSMNWSIVADIVSVSNPCI